MAACASEYGLTKHNQHPTAIPPGKLYMHSEDRRRASEALGFIAAACASEYVIVFGNTGFLSSPINRTCVDCSQKNSLRFNWLLIV
uniref:Uncharacterized protein n=1 Tax=Nelumbo nucifera TaxID=4432 RepID=A0A822ZNK8_NELNU|nr:TPA_asm: hypothetical protein HUJ06_016424 [Nelumbo nucifera]